MSLIVNALNKLKNKNVKKKAYPFKKSANNNKTKYIAYSGVILILITVLFLIYTNQKIFLYTETVPKNDLTYQEKPPPEKQSISETNKPSESFKSQIFNDVISTDKTQKEPAIQKQEKLEIKPDTKPQKNLPTKPKNYDETESKFSFYVVKGNKYLREGRLSESLRYYKKAYNIKQSDKILRNIIILSILTEKNTEAVKMLNRLKSDEEKANVLIYLIKIGKTHKVKKVLSYLLEKSATGYFYYVESIIYQKENNYQKALLSAKKSFELNPKDPYIAYNYGRLLDLMKKHKNAVKIYKHVLSLKIADENLKKVVEDRIRSLGGFNDE